MDSASDLPSLRRERLWLYINFDCNIACSYCVVGSGPKSKRPHMEPNILTRLVDEAVALGFEQMVITGGEPLLHPNLLSMLEYATSRVHTLLLTNAMLTTTRNFQHLTVLRTRNLSMQVSLDSADPARHDRRRGIGSWKRALDGINLLLEWGFPVSVRATITEQSDKEIEALYSFLERLGIPRDRIFGAPVAVGGRSREGLRLECADLQMEPTVAADGVYYHPLRVDPSQAVTGTILPLGPALALLAARQRESQARSATRGYR